MSNRKSAYYPPAGQEWDGQWEQGRTSSGPDNGTVMVDLAPAATTPEVLRASTSSPHYAAPMSGHLTPTSPYGSRPGSAHRKSGSLYPVGDPRSQSQFSMLDAKADVMCNWLYQQQLEKHYATGMLPGEGAVLKIDKNNYTCCPPQLRDLPNGLYDNIMQLNVRCAITVSTRVISVILNSQRSNFEFVPLPDGLHLQVLSSLADLPKCAKHHFAAFIQDAQMLVVWDDDPKKVLRRAEGIESQLMKMIWGTEEDDDEEDEKPKEEGVSDADLEAAAAPEERRIKLTSTLSVSMAMTTMLACTGLGFRGVAQEIMIDGNYVRLCLLLSVPPVYFISLFFFCTIFGNLFQIFGPISNVNRNSKYYSGKPPKRLNRSEQAFPHVTVQMPVYKEGLNGVIRPTISSIKQAISTYEMQGGTANVFINDDGIQLIPQEQAEARRDFYEENNIGWVSRPKHNPNPKEGEKKFVRRGKFKKASNMNYSLMVSNRVEDKLLLVARGPNWNQDDEDAAYKKCLQEVIEEDEGRTWADGNIRVGDYILIIDSDTRVPADCLLDAVSEMEQSQDVAIMQFTSGVMVVSTSYFEKGITWFTQLVYSAITFVVSNGDNCPFVGHNAILRWSAIQDACSYHDEDGYEKFWSESHVSEDFEISLQLQTAGYSLRFSSYTGDGFQEGVSLTVYDELARWEKYAFGCNELLFWPLKDWWRHGPLTPLFCKFLWSNIPLSKKITILSYIGTYYALGFAWPLTVLNYFLMGWFPDVLDKYYINSFAIYLSILFVFTLMGNVALSILRYRLGQQSFGTAFWNNLKWIPMMTCFMGGIELHVAQALISHFLSIEMNWGATAKEIEDVNFVEELPRLFSRFKGTFLACFLLTALMVCAAYAFPYNWRITDFSAMWPMITLLVSHFILPIALNPALMVFAW